MHTTGSLSLQPSLSSDIGTMTKKNILVCGATGYVGGTVLSRLLDHPDQSSLAFTLLVRSAEKADKLQGLAGNVRIEVGSTSDLTKMSELASDADIVVYMVDSDDADPVKAILAGLKTRHEKTGTVPSYIHTSSTAILCDHAMGMEASEIIHSDLDVDFINRLPEGKVMHRNVDIPIVQADSEGYVRTYIILPSCIYGPPSNRIWDTGVQNPDMSAPMWIGMAVACGGPRTVGEGKNYWGFVSNSSLADIFYRLFDAVSKDAEGTAHGRDGYYFANEGDFTMYEYIAAIGEVLKELGKTTDAIPKPFTEGESREHFTLAYERIMGGNSRAKADRATKSLGWKPTTTIKDFLADIKRETAIFVKEEGSRMEGKTPAMILNSSLAS